MPRQEAQHMVPSFTEPVFSSPQNLESGIEEKSFPERGDFWESQDGAHLVRIVAVQNDTVEAVFRSRNVQGKEDVISGGQTLIMSVEDFLRDYHFHPKTNVVNIEVARAARAEAEQVAATMASGKLKGRRRQGADKDKDSDSKPTGRKPRGKRGGGSDDGGDGTDDDTDDSTVSGNPVMLSLVQNEGETASGEGVEKKLTFDEALQGTQNKIESEIGAIDTPAAYALYRQEKLVHQKGDDTKYYLVDIDVIEELTGRSLNDGERAEVIQNFDKKLLKKLSEKFFDLKKSDLAERSRNWRAALNQVSDVVSGQQLMDGWSKEEAISQVWKDVWNDLSPFEQKIITEDYTSRFDRFKNELQSKIELFVFQTEFPETIREYGDFIRHQRTRFLTLVFSVRELTDDMKTALWEEKVLPVIQGQLTHDMIEKKSGLDSGGAERVFWALIQELNREFAERIRNKKQQSS